MEGRKTSFIFSLTVFLAFQRSTPLRPDTIDNRHSSLWQYIESKRHDGLHYADFAENRKRKSWTNFLRN